MQQFSASRQARPLEHPLARLDEAEPPVEAVRIARVEVPLGPREPPLVDGEPHQVHAQTASAMLLEHVDVGEVGLDMAVGDRAAESDLLAFEVEAHDPCGVVDQRILHLARSTLRPVRVGQIRVNGLSVDPARIVVELVAVAEIALHAVSVRRRKPPWNSYDATTTASASRRARSPRSRPCASESGLQISARIARKPSGARNTVSSGAH